MSALVHPTAIIDRHAELGADVEVGPYCVIGAGVRIDAGTRLISHVVVSGRTSLGKRNVVHPFAVLGGPPQLRKEGEGVAPAAPGRLVMGDDNVIREHVTINVASGDVPTTLGSKNLVMAGAHLAHDVVVGSFCVIANGVQLAGHVIVEDWVTFGGLAGVAQRLRVGEGAFVAGGAMCEREVPPFVIVQGDRARVRALNVVGLRRRGVPAASIEALERAFKRLFVAKAGGFDRALAAIDLADPFVAKLALALGARKPL